MDKTKAARQALYECGEELREIDAKLNQALATIREALAKQAEQEPVCCDKCGSKLGTTVVPCDCAAPMQQAEKEPVGRWNWNEAKFEWLTEFDYYKHHMTPLYAAPVRTKDLTDDEAQKLWHDTSSIVPMWAHHLHFARAVIAADREKNRE